MTSRNRRFVLVLVVITLVAFFSVDGGDESANPIDCVDDTIVLANTPEYIARPEKLQEAPGPLSRNCARNSRYCYYLSDDVPVYTAGNQTILDNFVGSRVVIVGKVVFPAQGPGEVWAGTICRLTL